MAIPSVGNSLAAIRVDARAEARFSSADNSTTAKLTRQYSAPLQEKTQTANQTANNVELSPAPYDNKKEVPPAGNDSVRVSSSIGRAASAGQLSREEAVAIYQKIADLL